MSAVRAPAPHGPETPSSAYPQPDASVSARQTSLIRWTDRRVIRVRNNSFGTSVRLSSESAHSPGMPSSASSRTSVGIRRIVRDAGTARSAFSNGIAACRVRTRNGRRPTSGCSTHQISLRATTARPLWPPARRGAPTHRAPTGVCVRSPQRSPHLSRPAPRTRAAGRSPP